MQCLHFFVNLQQVNIKLNNMLNKKVEEAINAQINAELWSAYLYLSMAAYCHAQGQPGMAKWFEVQFREEQDHAKIFFNYVVSRDGVVTLKPIEAVPTTWESMLDVFESTLAHEQKVTSLINNLYALATQELDFATQSMLKWFIDEQVEEEENASTIIDNIRMIKDNGYGLYMLDKELGARVYTQAAPARGQRVKPSHPSPTRHPSPGCLFSFSEASRRAPPSPSQRLSQPRRWPSSRRWQK